MEKKKTLNRIKNFTDFFRVLTEENYDRLTCDFLVMFHRLLLAKENMTEEEIKSFKMPYFEWLDDNECRIGYKFEGNEIIWLDKNC